MNFPSLPLHKAAQAKKGGQDMGWVFLLPGLTQLQMLSGVCYHPLQEVLLAVLCYFAGHKTDSSKRGCPNCRKPSDNHGNGKGARGEEKPRPSSLQKHPLRRVEQPGGAALGLAGRQEADDWSGPALALDSSVCLSLSQSYSQSKPRS